jgi:hypothetical protein
VATSEAELRAARVRRDAAREALLRTLEKTYGALVAELGRQAAEAFFPRARREDDEPPATA